MSKCICCEKREGEYQHSSGGYVCNQCIGDYFTCPDCGLLFDQETGDAGNGFCKDCDSEH